MLEVKIPEDVISYQIQKGIGITNKQAIYVALGLFIIIPLSIFGSNFLNSEIVGWVNMMIFILVCLPMVLEKNGKKGISGEEDILNRIYFYFSSQKRYYEYCDYEEQEEIDKL